MKKFVANKIVRKGKCTTRGCHNNPKGRTFCSSCRKKQFRERNPIGAAFLSLKTSAKRRGIFFDLTIEQFTEFCYKTDYIKGKGKTIGSYNVDRIIEGKTPGYTITNIQCLDKQKNIKKYFEYNWLTKQGKFINEPLIPEIPKEELPF